MADPDASKKTGKEIREELSQKIGTKATRKQKARREKEQGFWFWLGMFGLVGWSVAIPTLIGVVIGIWIDTTWPSRFSWTLMLLFVGVVVGCLNAWYWVTQERDRIEQGAEEQEHE